MQIIFSISTIDINIGYTKVLFTIYYFTKLVFCKKNTHNKIGEEVVSLLLSFPLRLTKESSPAGEILPDFLFTFEFSAIHPVAYDILQAF